MKIVFLCPYFGEMPKSQMILWLQSCAYNKDMTWIIFTDDRTKFSFPQNVKIEYMSFEEFQELVQSKFEYKVNLNKPYKLCDFKPAYGYILSDYIQGYDFWGHCDISDCIFGDLHKFLLEDVLRQYDKVCFLGHMTIYKNSAEVNKRFMIQTSSKVTLEEILGVSENKAFDELNEYSINTIYKENKFPMKRIDDAYYDISPLRFVFQKSVYDADFKHSYLKVVPTIFEWNKGCLFECKIENAILLKKEIGYVHFQKRKMLYKTDEIVDNYYIVPNKICTFDDLTVEKIKKICHERIYYAPFFRLKWEALKYRIKHL